MTATYTTMLDALQEALENIGSALDIADDEFDVDYTPLFDACRAIVANPANIPHRIVTWCAIVSNTNVANLLDFHLDDAPAWYIDVHGNVVV